MNNKLIKENPIDSKNKTFDNIDEFIDPVKNHKLYNDILNNNLNEGKVETITHQFQKFKIYTVNRNNSSYTDYIIDPINEFVTGKTKYDIIENKYFGSIHNEDTILKAPKYSDIYHFSDLYYNYYLHINDTITSSNVLNKKAQNLWERIFSDSFNKSNIYSYIIHLDIPDLKSDTQTKKSLDGNIVTIKRNPHIISINPKNMKTEFNKSMSSARSLFVITKKNINFKIPPIEIIKN